MTSTLTRSEVQKKLEPFEFTPGRKASWAVLSRLLPDIDTALFFAKAYEMGYAQLSALISGLFQSSVIDALFNGTDHSTDLQDYIVDTVPPDVWPQKSGRTAEDVAYAPIPHAEFLPAMWDYIDLQVATALKEVADTLGDVLDALPSKEGSMSFANLAKMNRNRPTIGVYAATITHKPVPDVLVIFDVSGSMSEPTVRALVSDVVALGWKANAHLAIVSDNTFYWEQGTYNVDDVLAKAEYNGTHYETLAPLFQRDWGTVITVADYDSSQSARDYIVTNSPGRVGKVLDLSLVNRPTYLAEVIGQLAAEVEPLLIGNSSRVIGSESYRGW
jgi:hypothetical protein